MLSFLQKAGSRFLGAIVGGLTGLVSGAVIGLYGYLRGTTHWAHLLIALIWGTLSGGIQFFVNGIRKGGSEGLTAGITYYRDVYQHYFATVNEIEKHAEEVRKAELPQQFPIDFLTDDQHKLLSSYSLLPYDDVLQKKLKYYDQFRGLRDPIIISSSPNNREADAVYSRERYLSRLGDLSSQASGFGGSFVTPTFTMGFPDKLNEIIGEFRQLLEKLRQTSSAKSSTEQPTKASLALSPKSVQLAATAGVGLWQPTPMTPSAPSLSGENVPNASRGLQGGS